MNCQEIIPSLIRMGEYIASLEFVEIKKNRTVFESFIKQIKYLLINRVVRSNKNYNNIIILLIKILKKF